MPREHGVTKGEYFHDQRGKYHDPQKINVGDEPTPESQKELMELDRAERAAADRLLAVLPEIQDDEQALRLVWAVIDAARGYTNAVTALGITSAKSGIEEPERFRGERQASDEHRRRKHEVLIDALRTYTRYIMKEYGKEELPRLRFYSGGGPARREIGEWGLALAKAAYAMPKRLKPYFKDVDVET